MKMKKNLKHIYFPVEKLPLTNILKPDLIEGMEFENSLTHGIFATTAEGKKRLVNACSQDYELMTNEELFQPIIDAFEQRYENIEINARQSNYCRATLCIRVKDKAYKYAKGTLFPEVSLTNSYDSSVRLKGESQIFRLECENGLSVATGKGKSINLMHTKGSAIEAEEFLEGISGFLDEAKEVIKSYDPLIEKLITPGRASELIEEVQKSTSYPKMAIPIAQARLDFEREQLKMPLNEFLVYNALNFGLFNSDSTTRDHKKRKVDQEVLQFLLP